MITVTCHVPINAEAVSAMARMKYFQQDSATLFPVLCTILEVTALSQ